MPRMTSRKAARYDYDDDYISKTLSGCWYLNQTWSILVVSQTIGKTVLTA